MPQFTFTAGSVDALVTALLAQTDRAQTMPAELRVPGKPDSNYLPTERPGS